MSMKLDPEVVLVIETQYPYSKLKKETTID